MTAITKDSPVYFGPKNDAHVETKLSHEQRETWERLETLGRERRGLDNKKVGETLQAALAPPPTPRNEPAPPAADTAVSAEPETRHSDGGTVPRQKQRAQETRILQLLKEQGHDPLKLPTRAKGKRGTRYEIRTIVLNEKPLIFSNSSFEKAWQRLRDGSEIVGGE